MNVISGALPILGGVPRRMRYDNLKPAVHKILTGKNRQEQAAWIAFRSHFLFESEYVTPGRGQEKGRSRKSGRLCAAQFFGAAA